MTARTLLLLVSVVAVPCFGEFRRISIDYAGEECASCAGSMTKSIQKIRGVERVSVDQQKKSIDITLAPGNRVPLGDIRDTIKRVGFTPGEARVVVHGTVSLLEGNPILQPDHLQQVYQLSGSPRLPAGGLTLQGTIPAPFPPARDRLIVKSAGPG